MTEENPREARVETRRQLLNRRLRATFIEGAEEDSRGRLGRGLTEEELRRIIRAYPCDVGGHS